MGLLSALTSSTFDPLVDKATSEENTSEDWGLILDICDRVAVDSTGPKECFRSIVRRLNSPIPLVVMQALALTDALVNNCGKRFHLEVCSREFETELRKLIANKQQPKVSERARQLIKKWSKEFKNDPQLSLMPALYEKLKQEGVSFKSSEPRRHRHSDAAAAAAAAKNPDAVGSAQEEADIAKAIELSLRDTKGGGGSSSSKSSTTTASNSNSTSAKQVTNGSSKQNGQLSSSSLYPSFNLESSSNTTTTTNNSASRFDQINSSASGAAKEPIKVRALYDFEAAEDNELTFKAGEIILVSDDSDANWWKGSNHRGDGLFPANFVTTDLNAEPEPIYKPEKKVQFSEEVKVKVLDNTDPPQTDGTNGTSGGASAAAAAAIATEIDESRIDRLLHLLHEADPQSDKCDSEELLLLEEQCVSMMPLIDQQMETIDKRHAALTVLTTQLNSALNLYHDLMKESLIADQQAAAAAAYSSAMMMPNIGGQPMMIGSQQPQMAYHLQQQQQQQIAQAYHPNQILAQSSQMFTPPSSGPAPSQPQPQPQPPPHTSTQYYQSPTPSSSTAVQQQQQQQPQPQPQQQQQQQPPSPSIGYPGPVPGMLGPIPGGSDPSQLAAYQQMYQSPTHVTNGISGGGVGPQYHPASPHLSNNGAIPSSASVQTVQSYGNHHNQHNQPIHTAYNSIEQQQQQQQMISSPHHMMLAPGGGTTAAPTPSANMPGGGGCVAVSNSMSMNVVPNLL